MRSISNRRTIISENHAFCFNCERCRLMRGNSDSASELRAKETGWLVEAQDKQVPVDPLNANEQETEQRQEKCEAFRIQNTKKDG